MLDRNGRGHCAIVRIEEFADMENGLAACTLDDIAGFTGLVSSIERNQDGPGELAG